IKKMYQMKLDGYSNSEILSYVQSTNLKTVQGNDFSLNSQIINILKDIKYSGQVIWGKTYRGKSNNEKVTFINNGEKPKYLIKNHHEPIIDLDTFNQVQDLLNDSKQPYTKSVEPKNPLNRFIYSLMHDSYLYVKVKHVDYPKHNLFENDSTRKAGSPRVYSRNATHVLRKATIALAHKFSKLEPKFDKQVSLLINTRFIDKEMVKIGEKIRAYKNEYFTLKQKDYLEQADLSLMGELEEVIIQTSIKYVQMEDRIMPEIDKYKRIREIKKAISSIELPMDELPLNTIKDIFDVVVVVDPENYVLVINASGKKLDSEALKKVTEVNPLLESSCTTKTKSEKRIKWKIIIN
ncbi:MAG: recombinase family protein, partial [Firmicutes bacterium]|nr:recombinase family protein [Bacillota bacterium]